MCTLSIGGGKCCLLRVNWQFDVESRANSLSRLEPETPFMPLDEFPVHKQSPSCSSDPGNLCIACSSKSTEDMCLLIGRNADPMILDTQFRHMCLGIFPEDYLDGSTCHSTSAGSCKRSFHQLLEKYMEHTSREPVDFLTTFSLD